MPCCRYQIDSYGAAVVAFGMIFDDFTMKVGFVFAVAVLRCFVATETQE